MLTPAESLSTLALAQMLARALQYTTVRALFDGNPLSSEGATAIRINLEI